MDSLPVKYLSLILLLIAALQFTNPVLIPVVPCGSDMPVLVNHTTPIVTLTSRYENCSIETNKSTYYLSKEEKGVVLTCKSQVPNRWVWNQIEESVKMVEVEKERLEVNGSVVFSSKLNVHFAEIINPDSFNFSCTNEIEYKYGEYPITCVTVQATVDNDANSLGPFKLSVLENIDSLPNCILNAKRFRTNCSINLAVDMSNITGICTSAGEPKSRICEDLDHCKSLIYINAENETCNAELQTFNATLKNQKSLVNHTNSPQIAFCQVLFDHCPRWESFLLLYPSFGKREWEKFDYYANMTEALRNNSIQLFALSQQRMKGNQIITSMRNEFAEDENVEFFCKAIFFLYMKGFRLRLGSTNSNGTVVEDQNQNHTTIDIYNQFYTFSQNISLNTKKYGNISWISCDGPVWNSRDWFSSTMNISIYRMTSTAEKPYVKLTYTKRENVTTFACTYGGWPRPTVTWAFLELVKFSYKSGHLPDSQSYNTTWSQIRVIRNRESSFNVTCTVKNFVGSTSQFITIKGLAEPRVLTKAEFIAIGCSIAMIILITALLTIIYFQRRRLSNVLTREEISQFVKGGALVGSPECVSGPYQKVQLELCKSSFTIDQDSLLGSGAYGRVCRGVVRKHGETEVVAIKMTNVPSTGFALRGLMFEIKILSYLGKHSNIVGLVGAHTAELRRGRVFVILELCELGSLQSYLRKCDPFNKPIECLEKNEDFENGDNGSDCTGGKVELADSLLKDMAQWAYEIANGMEFISLKNIVHLDIAARNILLTAEKQAKITDFGLSRRMYDYQSYIKTNPEPLPWRSMAPESLRRSVFTEKSDVWSFGVLLWEIYSLGDEPYPGLSWDVNFPTKLERGLRLGEPMHNTNSAYSIMLRCWNINPERRPTFKDLVSILNLRWSEVCALLDSDSNSVPPDHNYANISTEEELRS